MATTKKKYHEIPEGEWATITYPVTMSMITGISAIGQNNKGEIQAQGFTGEVYWLGQVKEHGRNIDVLEAYEQEHENYLAHVIVQQCTKDKITD